jgi:bifunctional non-homologous end joining protein LigD
VEEGLRTGSLKFVLKGRRLKGKWALIRIRAKAGETGNNWLLLKEKDDYAKAEDGVSGFTTSIRTGRSMAEIENGEDVKIRTARNPFDQTGVQLAQSVRTVPGGEDWLYELKYDGYRILAYLEGGSVRLLTRNGKDYTKQFQDVAYSLVDWAGGRAMVLDGEMVISDGEGRTDFQALQSYMKNPGGKKLTYIVFDLLALEGKDLRRRPLTDRKERLEALMGDSPENLYYSKHIRGNGKAGLLAACESKLEGIIGKKADSVYSGTRNGDWVKLKCGTRQEFVIGGYTLSDKKTSGVSSLLLGVYEEKELIYAGRAGTGLTVQSMKELEEKFAEVKREEPAFKQAPEPRKNEKIIWLEPLLVAEIQFAEWTEDNLLRQASFKGLRTDKAPGEIKRESLDVKAEEPEGGTPSGEKRQEERQEKKQKEEQQGDNRKKAQPKEKRKDEQPGDKREKEQPEEKQEERQPAGEEPEGPAKGNGKSVLIEGIRVTNPQKVIFEHPEIKKGDVVQYYAKVSERMMPYVGGRILSIVRCPKGISEACFYKKHPGPDRKGVATMPVTSNNGEKEEYFYIENPSGLLSEAQMGTLEFHTWGSRADDLEKPDLMVFDLDPDEGMDLEKVRQGVKDVKALLDQLSLVSFLKTSGGKGYHVVVPLKPSVGWEPFYDFARHIAEILEQKWPDRYTSNVRKKQRENRIFIDWIRNGRGATSIAPYSIRARQGAPVSMPIAWKELDTVAPDGVDMADALLRIGGTDPWKDFFQINQRLK